MGLITQNAPFCPNTEYPLVKLDIGCGHFCRAVNTLAPNLFYDNCRHWFFQCPWPMSNFLAAYTMLALTKKYGWCWWSCCILYSSTTISWKPTLPNLPHIRLRRSQSFNKTDTCNIWWHLHTFRNYNTYVCSLFEKNFFWLSQFHSYSAKPCTFITMLYSG